RNCLGVEVALPLPRLTYAEAMRRYGTDKPDLRYGLEITDVGDLVPQTQFQVFHDALAAGGRVRAICAPGGGQFTRRVIDELADQARQFGANGLAWVKVEAEKFSGGIEKFLPAAAQQALRARLGANAGDMLVFVADTEEVVCQALGNVRTMLASRLNLVDP